MDAELNAVEEEQKDTYAAWSTEQAKCEGESLDIDTSRAFFACGGSHAELFDYMICERERHQSKQASAGIRRGAAEMRGREEVEVVDANSAKHPSERQRVLKEYNAILGDSTEEYESRATGYARAVRHGTARRKGNEKNAALAIEKAAQKAATRRANAFAKHRFPIVDILATARVNALSTLNPKDFVFVQVNKQIMLGEGKDRSSSEEKELIHSLAQFARYFNEERTNIRNMRTSRARRVCLISRRCLL